MQYLKQENKKQLGALLFLIIWLVFGFYGRTVFADPPGTDQPNPAPTPLPPVTHTTDPANAQTEVKTETNLLVPIPTSGGGSQTTIPTPTEYIKILFEYALGLAALIAMAQLVYGAVKYTTSAGAPSLQEDAKARMRGAIIGLILLLISITILVTISSKSNSLSLPVLHAPPLGGTAAPTPTGGVVYTDSSALQTNPNFAARYYGTRSEIDGIIDGDPPSDALAEKIAKRLNEIELNSDKYHWESDPAGQTGFLVIRDYYLKHYRAYSAYQKYTHPSWAQYIPSSVR